MKNLFLLLHLFLYAMTSWSQQAALEHADYMYLNTWHIKAQSEINGDSSAIFTNSYEAKSWVNAKVPGTVFGAFVDAGIEKDPNYADNIYKVDYSKYNRNFWYRTSFTVPENYLKDKLWLNFEGVNRDADIFLNGTYLGCLKGIVQRGTFDISKWASKKENILAVLVHLPQQPISNGASPTYGSSGGWDWMPNVPGLNMGITQHVYLSTTGPVSLIDPWIQSNVKDCSTAELKIMAELRNNSSMIQKTVLKGTITPGNLDFKLDVELPPFASKTILIDHNGFPQLSINNPLLWWPNGYGEPNLYLCKLSIDVGNKTSDAQNISFGIRKLEVDTTKNVMKIKLNNVPIFVKGGNWGMSEYLLRSHGKEYDTRVKLHKDMNFNIIRNWMGSTTDAEFYDACDKYGILVWDDFWLNSSGGLPADIHVFNANAVEKLKRNRNHPCIALWCGDNEGDPLPPLDDWLRADVKTFDGRHYHPNSHSYSLTGSGPWSPLEPADYFMKAAPGNWGGTEGWGMRSEMGTAVFVNFESLKRFIPKENWWPRNDMWDKHFFGPSATYAGPDVYVKFMNERYGKPQNIQDYCKKAQLLNIETNKAMFEGWQNNLWADASGLIIWMSQSAYPSMVWQTYDYYFDANGAYWGAKKACEPIHIQWNSANDEVKIINTTRNKLENVTSEAKIIDLNGNEIIGLTKTAKINVDANSAAPCFRLPAPTSDFAYKKKVSVSSVHVPSREGDKLTDGDSKTRWESNFDAQHWAVIDLEEVKTINRVKLSWEGAFAKVYKIQVSQDNVKWVDAYYNKDCKGGLEDLSFNSIQARFVRLFCIEKASSYGISLYGMEVYGEDIPGLKDVHFIQLKLKDKNGTLLSDNFYLRGSEHLNYQSINSLSAPSLKYSSKTSTKDKKNILDVHISNAVDSKSIALFVRLRLVNRKSGDEILPFYASENYFSLLKGESKDIHIEYDSELVGNDDVDLIVEPYNSGK